MCVAALARWAKFVANLGTMAAWPVRGLVACFAMPASPTRKENVKSPAEGRQELVESFQGMCGRPPAPKGRPRSAFARTGRAAAFKNAAKCRVHTY